MQIVLNNNSSPFEKWFDRILFSSYKGLLKWNEGVFNFFKSLAGIIGLIIAIPILFVLAIIGWLMLLSLNYRMERDLTDYNTMVNSWDDRKKMEEHLLLEKAVRVLNYLMRKANRKKFIINPVTKQAIIFASNMSQMEQTLKKAAYPDFEDEPSPEEAEYLLTVFQESECDDWKHEKAISYED